MRPLSDQRWPSSASTAAPSKAAILALPDVVPLDVTAACQILRAELPGAGAPYRISVCGEAPGLVSTRSGFGLHVEAGPEALADADLVVIAGTLPVDPAVGRPVLDSLRAAHARGVPIVAMGSAAFVLARAGLLDGRRATTHWCHAGELARRYPRIGVEPEVLRVDDGGICTSAGPTYAVDLCLEMFRRGRDAAAATGAAGQSALGQPRPGQARTVDRMAAAEAARGLADVRQWMLNHLDQHTSLDELATRAFMSRRQFTRTFRAETAMSPWQWLLAQRLARARRLLEETDEQIEWISRRCGFPSSLAFRTKFKQVVGVSPSQYRKARRPAPADDAPVIDLFTGRPRRAAVAGAAPYRLSS